MDPARRAGVYALVGRRHRVQSSLNHANYPSSNVRHSNSDGRPLASGSRPTLFKLETNIAQKDFWNY